MFNTTEIRNELLFANHIPSEIINWVYKNRWLQIWVPQEYKGLGLNFKDGLQVLKKLAYTDGSLGWMVTLCAGANYFARNLKPETALDFFKDEKTCFGGSGMIGGTAEFTNNKYLINGFWKFATGAPHLSHFTLNAAITKNGIPVLNNDGSEQIKSFIIPKNQVEIIADWQAMGMKATGTFSFKVDNIWVDKECSFVYNEFYTNNVLDKIPFRIFADLTLLVNYIGLAEHFSEEALKIRPLLDVSSFKKDLIEKENKVYEFATTIERLLESSEDITANHQTEIHLFGENLVNTLADEILKIYFKLGIKASHTNEPIHQVFCDFFTATQHANFRRK